MANWSNPTLTSTYTDFLGELKNRDDDLAKQFDGTTSSNLATGTIRWNSTANRWQKWSGSAWAELTGTYALTALTTTGNASIGGTLAVTGATTLAAATATTPATGDNSTKVATTAYVRAQEYAPLASPALTGTPTVPTAAVNTNTTQAASTAFVQAEIANDAPSKTGTGASGAWGISVTGNAATVTTNANLTGDVTSVGNATSIAAGVIVNADISATAAIADTKLATISTAGKVSGTAITSGDIATSGNLEITNATPSVRLTESDGAATHSQTVLLRNGNDFVLQTRSSTGVALSDDYRVSADASGATAHIWRTANVERLRIKSDGESYFQANNTSSAVTINQTSTGNALVVEDSTNPDATPFVITANGSTLVGTTAALANAYAINTATTPALQIEGNTGSTAAVSITRQTGAASNLLLQRGVTGTPVTDGMNIGAIQFNGFDGTNFRGAARIFADVEGTPGTGVMPGRLIFATTPSGSATPTECARITSTGAVLVGATAAPTDVADGDIALQNRLVMNAAASDYGQFQRIANVGATSLTATTGTIVFKFKSASTTSARSAYVKINLSGRSTSNTLTQHPVCEYAFQLHQTSAGVCTHNGLTTIFEYTFSRGTHFAFANLGSGECTVTLTNPVAVAITAAYMVEINTQGGTFGLDTVTIT